MIKKISYTFLMSLFVLVLAACAATATPISPGQGSTSVPPTLEPTSTSTPIPPTETSTAVPTTATPTVTPANAIQHLPAGQELTVTFIHMIDSTNGWAIGGLGTVGDHVLFTTDGGTTWKDVTPPQPVTADNAQQTALGFFQDARSAWVTYSMAAGYPVPSQPVVWRTADGGTSWQASQPLDIANLAELFIPSDLQFVAGQDGWLLVHVGVGMNHDYVVIYRTSDGGATWSRIIDPYNDGGIQSCSKNEMLFTDATHGWLTGDCNGVKAGALLYKTTDAGSTWQEVTLPEPASYPGIFSINAPVSCGTYNPFFFSNDLGHMAVNCRDFSGTQITESYFIYSTQDGGITWTTGTYPGASLYFFSADTGWAIANKIQLTSDGGKTWKPLADVTWKAQMDFISEQIGWAVARSESATALVHSDDGGAHWSKIIPGVGP